MPNLRSKTWTTTTPANVEDAQYWEDHLISDAAAAKAASSVQTVNNTAPDANGNVDIVALPSGGTTGQVLTKQSSTAGDADWQDPASSGHTIQNPSGTSLPYQSILQFKNATVSNDSTNSKTVVDCHGEKGDKGDTGATGATPDITMTASVDGTSLASPTVTVTQSGTAEEPTIDLAFSGLKGAKGDTGDTGSPGAAATISAGSVSTLPAGSSATVTNSGTSSAAVFDFGIPQGADGADGTDGISVTGVSLYSTSGREKTYRMTFSSGSPFDYVVTDGADGTGAGDMLKSDYDSDSAVYNAGGIASYVSAHAAVYSAGTNIQISSSNVISATDTTYSDATQSASGLMSSTDKTKLDGIASGAEVNVQADWNEANSTSDAYINNKPSLAAVAVSGAYSDLSGTPTIPDGLADLTDDVSISSASDGQFLKYDGTASKWKNQNVTIPTVNDATLTIQQNGTQKATFTSNASSNATANIITDEWTATATVSSGSVSFSGLDDTQGWGFKPYVLVNGNSTNKNPSCEISSISGAGTSSMSISYTTDADNGATVKLRIVK